LVKPRRRPNARMQIAWAVQQQEDDRDLDEGIGAGKR
jgi:hypothetical protein